MPTIGMTPNTRIVLVSCAALSVALIVVLFAFDEREQSLYEPMGKIGFILLFCTPHSISLAYLSLSNPRAFRFAKLLAIVVLVPLVPYLRLITLFAAWAWYPLLYALMVLFGLTQVAIAWATSRASIS